MCQLRTRPSAFYKLKASGFWLALLAEETRQMIFKVRDLKK